MLSRLTRVKYLSDAELAAFMAAVRERRHVNQPRDYALFALLANTGIRPSEALALTPADIHLRGPEPWIRVVRLKKRRPAEQFDELQITEQLAAIVLAYAATINPQEHERLFAVNRRQAERLFHHYAKLAGLRRSHWLYSLRHTAATRIYMATRDIRLVQAILGHERPDMSCLYAHVGRALLAETAKRFPVEV